MVATRRSKLEEPLVRRLVRGAVGGVAAGLVFVAVTMWFAQSTGGKAEMPLRMISTLVKGDQAMAAGTTSPALGVAVHLVLSALFGMANQPFEVFAHLVFGTLLSFVFFGSGVRRAEPVLALGRRSTGVLP